MADTDDQELSSGMGALPLTAYNWPDIPPDFRKLAPERPGAGNSMVLVHPPMAAVIAAAPLAMVSAMIKPGLEAGYKAVEGRDVSFDIDRVVTEDGLVLLFIHEGVSGV
jgi:hypothetical protein